MSAVPAPTVTPRPTTQPWFHFYPEHELVLIQGLPPEAAHVLMCLRMHAWVHGPIPNDDFVLRPLLKSFNSSLLQFRRHIQQRLEKFFGENPAFFSFSEDEQKRLRIYQGQRNSTETGQIGGLTRVEKLRANSRTRQGHPLQPEPEPELKEERSSVQEDLFTKEPASHPALHPDQQGREVGRQSQTKANGKHPPPLEPAEYQQLSEHCVKLGLHPASENLAPRLKQKLISAGVPPDDWIKKLGKFDKQTSAGLWDQKTAAELIAQSDPALKRKAMTPVQAMIAEAEERLAAKRAGGTP